MTKRVSKSQKKRIDAQIAGASVTKAAKLTHVKENSLKSWQHVLNADKLQLWERGTAAAINGHLPGCSEISQQYDLEVNTKLNWHFHDPSSTKAEFMAGPLFRNHSYPKLVHKDAIPVPKAGAPIRKNRKTLHGLASHFSSLFMHPDWPIFRGSQRMSFSNNVSQYGQSSPH